MAFKGLAIGEEKVAPACKEFQGIDVVDTKYTYQGFTVRLYHLFELLVCLYKE